MLMIIHFTGSIPAKSRHGCTLRLVYRKANYTFALIFSKTYVYEKYLEG